LRKGMAMRRFVRPDRPGLARRLLAALVLILGSSLTMADDWPTYMHDTTRSGASQNESTLSTASVPQLVKLCAYQTGSVIAAQPILVNGTVYVGSWDGYEYALNAGTGVLLWKAFLGTSTEPCANQGVTSAPAVQNGVLYLGGGDSYWYALDATTG